MGDPERNQRVIRPFLNKGNDEVKGKIHNEIMRQYPNDKPYSP